MTFFSALYAAIKAVSIINGWVTAFLDFYTQKEITQAQQANASLYQQKLVLAKKIRETKDPNEKAVILTTYNNL